MNKTNNCLMIGSYIFGLNKLFLHTDKNHRFLLFETNECRKSFAFFDFVSVHVCSQFIFT